MATEGESDELSPRINIHPRDLLQRFAGEIVGEDTPAVARDDMGEVELRLGLSLGGCFGVESKEKRLVRASSISTLSIFPVERSTTLKRTWSMPVESEEENRKRKGMQSLKRLEAKRKRLEKRVAAIKDRKKEKFDEKFGKLNGVGVPAELPRWPARPSSQRSIGSQGSCSSVVSDFESCWLNPVQGINGSGPNNCTELRTPAEPTNLSKEEEHQPEKRNYTINGAEEMERSVMEEMPCVSTKGDGPNGRRVEGFLYKYRKGEEVRIVCVCHGTFLTPAEFVKHAGGGNVVHPLRHIVVNPAPSAFL